MDRHDAMGHEKDARGLAAELDKSSLVYTAIKQTGEEEIAATIFYIERFV